MASIFRPTYTAKNPDGTRTVKQSPTWWVRYYLPTGERRQVKGYRDRKATTALAAQLERDAERADAGFTDATAKHAARPLTEHVDEFEKYLAGKGNTAAYVLLAAYRLRTVVNGCQFVRISDLQPSAVTAFAATLRADGKGIKTVNEHIAAVRSFARWLLTERRIGHDPLAGLSKLKNADTDIRHGRRDLTPDEIRWLLACTGRSRRTKYHLDGQSRRLLYLTALATGFRVSELKSLTPESFDLAGTHPTVTCKAACTKNRKMAVQPLPIDAAIELAPFIAETPAGTPLWPGKAWPVHASIMLKLDMAEARNEWMESREDGLGRDEYDEADFLAYVDRDGRYCDFHALRHSFITMIGMTGISARAHMDLARHSTYAMTSRYTHSKSNDLARAANALPIMTGTNDEHQRLRATGTDGKSLVPFLVPQRAKTGDNERRTEILTLTANDANSLGKQGKCDGNKDLANDSKRSGIRESNPSHSLGKAVKDQFSSHFCVTADTFPPIMLPYVSAKCVRNLGLPCLESSSCPPPSTVAMPVGGNGTKAICTHCIVPISASRKNSGPNSVRIRRRTSGG